MKKVLYITYDGLTDPLGQSQILPYLQNLSKQGYQFTILSFEKKARYQKEGATVKAIAAASNIHWVPLLFTAKPPVLSKMYDRYQMWQTTLSLHKQTKFDLVHCRSYIAAEMGLRLKEKYGVKMLFDMRGFWADEKVDNGQWNLKRPFFKYIYSFYKKREKEFLLKADGIVSLTQAAKDYLLQKTEYRHLAIKVIPCCADLMHFNYAKVSVETTARQKATLNIPADAKVLVYLGSIGGWYMTDEMFAFFAEVLTLNPNYVMLVLTKDNPELVKLEAAKKNIPSNKIFVTYSSRKELPKYLSMCQSSVFFIRNTFSKMASSPTKHAELMGMGIPVICNDIGDTGHIIKDTNTGLLINDFDKVSLQTAVKKLPHIEQIDKSYIQQCAYHRFDLVEGSNKYLSLYQQIFKESQVMLAE